MGNSSNKNFPHAYGTGRVIAAFELCHPGGPQEWVPGEDYAPPASECGVLPPALVAPSLADDFPYPDASPDYTAATDRVTYRWERQPYNATSLGVFATGSGLASLGYRDTLVGGMDGGVFAGTQLAQSFPTPGVYPFSEVDASNLGSTSAQVVITARGSGVPCSGIPYPTGELIAGSTAYYEVGLNWTIPPLREKFPLNAGSPDFAETVSNWASQRATSVTRELQKTCWVNASLSSSAYANSHPLFPEALGPGITLDGVNRTFGPVNAGGSVISDPQEWTAPTALSEAGFLSPYGGFDPLTVIQENSFYQPAYSPTTPYVEGRFAAHQVSLQAEVYAFGTSLTYTQDLDTQVGTATLTLVPRVRIWVLLPQENTLGNPFSSVFPSALPRSGITPRFDQISEFSMGGLPAVSVQVMQKNSGTADGTDGPVYDLPFAFWSQAFADYGAPAPAPAAAIRERTRESLDENVLIPNKAIAKKIGRTK